MLGAWAYLLGTVLRTAADEDLSIVGITLLHRKGYFRQRLDSVGNQVAGPDPWNPVEMATLIEPRVSVTIEDQLLYVRAWRYLLHGREGRSTIPVYMLDTHLEENSDFHRTITDTLYTSDQRTFLCQHVVLGCAGLKLLRLLGYDQIEQYHMNESHSALLALELLRARTSEGPEGDWESIRRRCIFTIHKTPGLQGQAEAFSRELLVNVLGQEDVQFLESLNAFPNDTNSLSTCHLALRSSGHILAVSASSAEMGRGLFPRFPITGITNGVHANTFTSPAFKLLFDRELPAWRQDNNYLRHAVSIPTDAIRSAHRFAKQSLIDALKVSNGAEFEPDIMTIGCAHQPTRFSRIDLLFRDIDKLISIARMQGPFQIVMGGKAHPDDETGQNAIRSVFRAAAALRGVIKVVYIENYDMHWTQQVTAGVDLWLNTSRWPHEGGGSSGMKAALNGVPSLSSRVGWWSEGHVEGMTGWSIERLEDPEDEATSLYNKLEREVLPLFYGRPDEYVKIMQFAIALNGGSFNSQRMLEQFIKNFYAAK